MRFRRVNADDGLGGREQGRQTLSLNELARSDEGVVRLPIIIAAGAVAMFMVSLTAIPIFFGANQLYQGAGGGGNNCTDTSQAAEQPQPSSDASGIPANYLQLYKAAGQKYGVPWNLLAAIGKVESDHGRDPGSGVHSGANYAGAAGPMQIGIGGAAGNNWGGAPRHRASEKTSGYGVDGNGDGWVDVHDPADAIPAAARYLRAHGAPNKMRSAVFAYNPSAEYVDKVVGTATQYSGGKFDVVQANGPTCADMNGAPAAPSAVVAKAITWAKAQLGKPYIFGGMGPNGYDCSSFTMFAYRAAGVNIPRLSDAQYWWGAEVPKGQEQQGDLVFFDYKPGHSGPGHVGMVYNPQKKIMLVAPHTGDVIKFQSYGNYPGGVVGFTRPTAHNGKNGPKEKR